MRRQLKRAALDEASLPTTVESWRGLIERVSVTYAEHDQERYLVERSLTLSSAEMQDLTRRLKQERDQLHVVLSSISDGLCALDAAGHALFMNAAGERLLGWSEQELVGTNVLARIGVDRALAAELAGSGRPHADDNAEFRRKDGSGLAVSYSLSPINTLGTPSGAVLVFRDVAEQRRREGVRLQLVHEKAARAIAEAANTAAQAEISERKRVEAVLAYQATHDALTGLPNRTLLYDRMEQAIRSAPRRDEPLALLLMDLDRFKEINDTLGHQAGDELLQKVAERLSGALRTSDTVARLGGDEFAILLPATTLESARLVAAKLITAVERGVVLDDQLVDVGASVGIAQYPAHGQDATTLLRRADVAMYAAKRSNSGYLSYASDQDTNSQARLGQVGELREAIEHGDLVLVYQPKVSFDFDNVIGVEALVRWNHPQRGLIAPDLFIPLAEQTGLIRPLTQWVLNTALRQCRAWLDRGLELTVSVNLSMRNLQDLRLPEIIADLLAETRVDPCWLKLEITESMIMADPARAQAVLARLRAMGLQMEIDDFGTGYSSLAYLKTLAVDVLKIDRSFVREMVLNDRDAAIVRASIELAHNLGLSVVAEGVEDRTSSDMLASLGCDVAQGFYFSRPLPAEQLEAWLDQRQTGQRAATDRTTGQRAAREQSGVPTRARAARRTKMQPTAAGADRLQPRPAGH